MTCGIYCICNTANNKKYIGQSVNVEERLRRHKYELLNNKHFNKHLQRAWNKHGEENFTFEQVLACDMEHLDMYERLYIIQLRTFDRRFGYNIEHGGNTNKTVSQATRAIGSTESIESSTASEIWSQILSGCPSVTDSEVKNFFILNAPLCRFLFK